MPNRNITIRLHHFAKQIAVLLAIVCLSSRSFATQYVSNIAAGLWNTPASWLPAGVPTAADTVTVQAGQIITMNANPGACINLTISGTLTWTVVRTLNISGKSNSELRKAPSQGRQQAY